MVSSREKTIIREGEEEEIPSKQTKIKLKKL